MDLDIQYLLFLQDLRGAAPSWLNALLTFFSEFTVSYFCILFPAVLFWCVSKRSGSYLYFSMFFSNVCNGFIKNTVCAYRPWIRDSRVDSTLKATATGYSFPSGHTMTAVSIYGGTGMLLKKRGVRIWLLCFLPAVLTGFARNWVGAHTPQDVICGFLAALLILILTERLMGWIAENPPKDVFVTAFCIAAAAAILLYVSVKSYPLDYNADGMLLVDPQEMMNDCFKNAGKLIGFSTGWLIERRLIRFDMEIPLRQRVLRGIAGAATAWFPYKYLKAPLTALIGEHFGPAAANIILLLYITAIYPAVFCFAERKWMRCKKFKKNEKSY